METKEKADDTAVTYPVMEHFYTLQGEGAFTGQASYFIRLGGCNVGCPWCDVKESWDATLHPKVTVRALVDAALSHPSRMVVITGGEPTMHDLFPLTRVLKKAGFEIHLETAATNPITGILDWVTLSPKKSKKPLEENLKFANELKVVIFHPSDFQWAETYEQKVNKDCKLYLQPEWGRIDRVTPMTIEYIEQHPQWNLSLQTHKYVHIR